MGDSVEAKNRPLEEDQLNSEIRQTSDSKKDREEKKTNTNQNESESELSEKETCIITSLPHSEPTNENLFQKCDEDLHCKYENEHKRELEYNEKKEENREIESNENDQPNERRLTSDEEKDNLQWTLQMAEVNEDNRFVLDLNGQNGTTTTSRVNEISNPENDDHEMNSVLTLDQPPAFQERIEIRNYKESHEESDKYNSNEDSIPKNEIEEKSNLQENNNGGTTEPIKTITSDLKQKLDENILPVIESYDSNMNLSRIILIGKTGVGKSETGNTILGQRKFETAAGFKSCTATSKKEINVINCQLLEVIDTPGLYDTSKSEEMVRDEIAKCLEMVSPGPHVFLVILTVGRITEQEKYTLKYMTDLFGGQEFLKHTIIVITRKEELNPDYDSDNDDEDFDVVEELAEFVEDSEDLKRMVEQCKGRCVAISNAGDIKGSRRRGDAEKLIQAINQLIEENEGLCYSNALFEALEKEKEEQMREAEIKRQNASQEKQRREDERKREIKRREKNIERLEEEIQIGEEKLEKEQSRSEDCNAKLKEKLEELIAENEEREHEREEKIREQKKKLKDLRKENDDLWSKFDRTVSNSKKDNSTCAIM